MKAGSDGLHAVGVFSMNRVSSYLESLRMVDEKEDRADATRARAHTHTQDNSHTTTDTQ